MLGKRIINTATGAAPSSCTTDTVQILDGVPFQSIATYQLDGNANDLTTNHNGTWVGTEAYTTGKFGQAATFNGSNQGISLPSVNLGSNFTISCWYKYDGNDNNYNSTIVGSSDENPSIIHNKISTSNNISYDTSGSAISILSNVITNTWYNIVVTQEGTKVNTYVNGAFSSNGTTTALTATIEGIGYDPNQTRWLSGSVDQVRLFNKALSAADVTTLYNETVATASTNPTFNAPSLVAYYKMSDATDETGSYDGTPTNVNFNVAGKFGNAGDFNGSTSLLDASGFNITGDRSVSFWVKNNSSASGATVLNTCNTGSSGTQGILVRVDTSVNKYYLSVSPPASPTPFIGDASSDWVHITVVDDSTNYKLYYNGSYVTQTPVLSTREQLSKLRLGKRFDYTQYFSGKIDQIRIFDKAITSDEVTTLYNEVYCQPTIVPTDHFEPVLYTGNGSTQSISTLDFQPDLVWVKCRSFNDPSALVDSVRGASETLFSDNTNEQRNRPSVTAFDSNGFTLGDYGNTNRINDTYVAWNWKAGGDDVQNTDGTITSQVSANTEAGFSIVKFTGNTETAPTVGHGLNSEPEIYFLKGLDNGTDSWIVGGNRTIFSSPSTNFLRLNTNNSVGSTGSNAVGSNGNVINIGVRNYNTQDTIAYCFHSVDGMSKIGSYVGTGSGNTVNVVTGFRPAMIIIKRTDSVEDWKIIDNKRDFANSLEPNESIAEEVGNNSNFSSHSNGFTIGDPHGDYNANGGTYIFMAFAEEVFVADNFFNDDSTLATYKLNGDAGDDSGNGNNGTASNITYATGKFDDAASFNGSSSIIKSTSLGTAYRNQTTLTLSGWIKTSGHSSSTQVNSFIGFTDTNEGSTEMILYFRASQGNVIYINNRNNSTNNIVAAGSTNIADNNWHHFAFVADSSGTKLYLDGVPETVTYSVGSSTTQIVMPNDLNQFNLGANQDSGGVQWHADAELDQVRIFDRALDAEEVTQLYNE